MKFSDWLILSCRFRKDLSCEHIILKAFGTNDKVSSIRKSKLPEHHMELVEQLREAVNRENAFEAERRKTRYSGKKSSN